MPLHINFNEINFIEKKYVHKTADENVHVYNLRRSLPRVIPAKIFEGELASKLEMNELDFLSNYYLKKNVNLSSNPNLSPYSYIFRNLPYQMGIKELDNLFIDENVNESDRNYILQFYKKDEKNKKYTLTENYNELEELRLARILYSGILFITDSEKTEISRLLEKTDSLVKEDIFVANIHIDPNHNYFFEHSLDHVPGMMLIEIARQFFVGCAHIYGKVPLEGVFFTLNKLDVEFSEYLWMSYPTRVELRLKKTTYTEEGYWFKCVASITFFQEHRVKSRISVEGMTVKMPILENIIIKKQMQEALKFNTFSGLQSEVYLRDKKNNLDFIGNIVDVSPKHVMVEFIEAVELESTDEFHFKINLEKSYCTYGTCVLSGSRKNGKRLVASFKFTHVDPACTKNIHEIIKRLCHVREQRGII